MKRRTILLCFLITIFYFFSSHAQQGRLIVSPMLIVDITSFGTDTLVAAGGTLLNPVSGWPASSGFLARSTDGGDTWHICYRENSTAQLHKVISLNDSVGFAVADSGIMYRTVDAGLTWKSVTLNTNIHVYNIEFTDALTGYATGSEENYLKTVDGGATWTLHSVGASYNGLYDIFWLDNNTGFLCGEKSYSTYDGGLNWTTSNSPHFGVRLKQHWKNDLEGWLVTGSYLARTNNGGVSWTIDSAIHIVDFHQYSPSHFIGVGDTMVYQTTDSGNTWTQVSSFPQNFAASSVHFTDLLTGYAGGSAKIYKTTDGGVTWNASGYDHDFSMTHVFAFDSLLIYTFIWNSPPTCNFTQNGGLSWQQKNMQGLPWIHSFDFINPAIGFAAGDGLYKTIDSAKTWNLVNPLALSEIRSFDENHLFAYDDSDNFLTSTDGGMSWAPSVGFTSHPILAKVNALTGFASVGNTLYRTVDGGITWNDVNVTGILPWLWHMADDLHGVARAHNTDDIYTTSDGGTTWTYRSTSLNVSDLLMKDPATIFMISGYGCFSSVDSGITFSAEDFNFNPEMTHIVKSESGDIIFFGKYLAVNPVSGFPLCTVVARFSPIESAIFEFDQFTMQNEATNALQHEWRINGFLVSSSATSYNFMGINLGSYEICLRSSSAVACYDEICDSVTVVPYESQWLLRTPQTGSLRTNRATFVINNILYECTGANGSSGTTYNNALNLDDLSWQPAASLPGPQRHSAVGFSIDGKGYVGLGINNNMYLKDLWQYDPVTDSWVQKANFPGSGARGSSCVVIDGKAYIINGSSFDGTAITYYNECWEYNPVSDTWLQRSSFPGAGRIYTMATAVNGLLICGGGNRLAPSVIYDDYYQFNPVLNQWTSIPPIPANAFRTNGQTFSRGNKAYFMGGYFPSNNETTLYAYDVISSTWDSLAAKIPDVLLDAYCIAKGDSVFSCFPYYSGSSHNVIYYFKFAPLPVGVDESTADEVADGFTIYPNPSTGKIYINNDRNQPVKKISLYSADNKFTYSGGGALKDIYTINIPKAGIYSLLIETEGGVYIKKVIVYTP